MSKASGCLERALEQFFGGISLRSGQIEALEAVRAGEDALVIMPTGAGKSLIYQLAALEGEGTTLVVSPLIALMHDQITDLGERGYPGAAALHSNMTGSEQRATLAALGEGRLRLLYTTPERCAQEEFLAIARRAPVRLMAVDEAHCISEWGHDFCTSYLVLADAARILGRPPLLALTASATRWVREDITGRLHLHEPRTIVRGFDRPNLYYEVYATADEREKRAALLRIVGPEASVSQARLPEPLATAGRGAGIVYTRLTRSARSLSQWLNRSGVLAAYYHGKLKPRQRTAVQECFREGGVRAIAATNAFGLGIDLPNLRFVAHLDAPPTLEAYYQESGRAGRDGEPARCPLLFCEQDLGRVAFAGGSGALDRSTLERVVTVLGQAPAGGAAGAALAREAQVSLAVVQRALELLLAGGAVTARRGRFLARDIEPDQLGRVLELDERRQEHDRTRLEMVKAYAHADGCRRQFLLHYLGEYDAPAFCGMCDRCLSRKVDRDRSPEPVVAEFASDSPCRAGEAVTHENWGAGIVQQVESDPVTVLFEQTGYRTLDVETILELGLLRRRSLPRSLTCEGPHSYNGRVVQGE